MFEGDAKLIGPATDLIVLGERILIAPVSTIPPSIKDVFAFVLTLKLESPVASTVSASMLVVPSLRFTKNVSPTLKLPSWSCY